MNVDSFGDERPAVPGDTDEAHRLNRRVELRLEK
jgi:outer membrane protein OmpA-like peptidoglycan-associated protein